MGMYLGPEDKAKLFVGNKVAKIYAKGDAQLRFVFESGHGVEMETRGDCCSCSFFNDINGIDALIDEYRPDKSPEILSFCEIEDPRQGLHSDWQSIQFYGLQWKTYLGVCEVIFRNESNGYYGGYCEYFALNAEKAAKLDGYVEITKNGGIA